MRYLTLFLLFFSLPFSYGQWTQQTIQTSNSLTSVNFKTDDLGFTCGGNKIFKTVNGGMQWTLSFEGGNLFQFEDIKAFGDVLVIAVGLDFTTGKSLIIRSENGGDSWSPVVVAANSFLKSVIFVDDHLGFCSGGDGTILKSTDAGAHWTAQNSGTITNLQSIFFRNSQTGFAAGGAPPSEAILLKTSNGGINWTPVPFNATSNLQSICFTDSLAGYIVGWTGGIFKTTNGGNTWSPQTSVNMAGNLEVFFTDAQTGYVVGGSSNTSSIQKTSNGGMLWEEIGPNIPQGLISVFFPSLETGYVVGSGGTVLKTTTAGLSANQEITRDESLQCYPNPVSGMLTVHTSGAMLKSISLFDSNGRLIQTATPYAEYSEIDFSALAPGNYYVKIENGKDQVLRKIVKI